MSEAPVTQFLVDTEFCGDIEQNFDSYLNRHHSLSSFWRFGKLIQDQPLKYKVLTVIINQAVL